MSVDEFFIPHDIKVLCVKAGSFPDGVQAAHKRLRSLVASPGERIWYGISYAGKNGAIIYKAATEELSEEEAQSLNVETFVIRRGKYISAFLKDWQKEEALIGKTFKKLLSDPRIDKNGYCLEIYLNDKDMRCLVPLDPSNSETTSVSQPKDGKVK